MKDSPTPPQSPTAGDYAPTKNHTNILVLCVAVIAMGGFLFMQYLNKIKLDAKKMEGRAPMITALKDNLEAIDQAGKTVNIGQLEGKVWVAGFLYTLCPRGCAGLAEEMKKLQDEFGSNPKFQLVSVSLNAEWDTPERLSAWTAHQGYKGDNWWFLTGDGPKLRGYMKDQFKLPIRELPKAEQKNEFDKWEHKLALVLVDSKLRVRGAYDFSSLEMNDLFGEKLRKDLVDVLKEAEDPTVK